MNPMKSASRSYLPLSVLALLSLVGCGAEAVFPGGDNRTVVIRDGAVTTFDNPAGGACLTLPGGACVSPQEKCGAGAHAEVVLGADGKVETIVCYPDKVGSYSIVDQQAAADNKGLLVLDGSADGPDILGDLTVSGEKAIVYGQGPAGSVVGGNVSVSSNNVIVRGLTVLGNTSISGNNNVMYHCVILGDVTISANDNVLSACDIYGSVTITGNNNELRALRIQGTVTNKGNGNVCTSDVRFTDANQNKIIEPGEVGAALSCK